MDNNNKFLCKLKKSCHILQKQNNLKSNKIRKLPLTTNLNP